MDLGCAVEIIRRVCSGVEAANFETGILKNFLHAVDRRRGVFFVLDCNDRSNEVWRNP
jgi:hypothetical protein